MSLTLEVIATSLADIAAAGEGGADRIELCQGLSEGALTPSLGFMEVARRSTRLPIVAIIRARGGPSVYSPAELDLMERDIILAREAGMDGVVFCATTPEMDLDLPAFIRLAEAAGPMEVVCSRHVDFVRDLPGTISTLASLPAVKRVLTAGGPLDTEAQKDQVRRLAERYGDRLQIMTGVGLAPENVGSLIRATGVSNVHIGWGCRTPAAFTGANDPGKIAYIRAELTRIALERGAGL